MDSPDKRIDGESGLFYILKLGTKGNNLYMILIREDK